MHRSWSRNAWKVHTLVDHAHHPPPTAGIGLVHQRVPVRTKPAMHRDVLADWVVVQIPTAGVAGDQGPGIEDGTVVLLLRNSNTSSSLINPAR